MDEKIMNEKKQKISEKIESAKRKAAAIEFITSVAVGFPVVLCIGKPEPNSERARRTDSEFQIMPEDEFKSNVEAFFDWHIENNEQWFEVPVEAAANFVEMYQKFCAANK